MISSLLGGCMIHRCLSVIPASAALCGALILSGCASIPERTEAVQYFSLDRFLGRWYEIARLDHGFERGLDCVSATYTRRDDGGVRVVNRGVDLATGEVSEAEGKAYFVAGPETGRFKVSFFGPFYGGYNVLKLDRDYEVALVAGNDRSYLWLLARTPKVAPAVRGRYIAAARSLDFPTDQLIDVKQGTACADYRQR